MSPERLAVSNRSLAQIGAAVGAEYHMDWVVISNTGKANELLHFAEGHDNQVETREPLFRAYWTEGRRLGRVEDLVKLAGEIGLEGKPLVGRWRQASTPEWRAPT